MPHGDIDRIREKIRLRQYDMSVHAIEEMAEDCLTIMDVEEAIQHLTAKHDITGQLH